MRKTDKVMTLSDCQREAAKGRLIDESKEESVARHTAALLAASGCVATIVNDGMFQHRGTRQSLVEATGDLIAAIAALLDEMGIELEEAFPTIPSHDPIKCYVDPRIHHLVGMTLEVSFLASSSKLQFSKLERDRHFAVQAAWGAIACAWRLLDLNGLSIAGAMRERFGADVVLPKAADLSGDAE